MDRTGYCAATLTSGRVLREDFQAANGQYSLKATWIGFHSKANKVLLMSFVSSKAYDGEENSTTLADYAL